MENKKVILRARDAGVFYGELVKVEGDQAHMKKVRKLWYWDGAAAVEQLANDGVAAPNNCKFTVTVDSMVIFNPIQIIPCTDRACESIEGVKEWKR